MACRDRPPLICFLIMQPMNFIFQMGRGTFSLYPISLFSLSYFLTSWFITNKMTPDPYVSNKWILSAAIILQCSAILPLLALLLRPPKQSAGQSSTGKIMPTPLLLYLRFPMITKSYKFTDVWVIVTVSVRASF